MPKKRDLSEFLAKELLYDYVTGGLDDERRIAVEKSLRENEEVSKDLKALSEGSKYCENLRNTKLSEPLFSSLSEPPKTLRDHANSWRKVRPPVRHSVEATVIALFIGVIVVFIPKKYRPWEADGNYAVVEVKRESSEPQQYDITTTTLATVAAIFSEVDAPVVSPVPYGPFKMVNATTPSVTVTTIGKPLVLATAPKETSTTVVPSQPRQAKATRGELYRVYMISDKVNDLTPEFVAKITSLGGAKAGEVQLGWRRKQGSYFHFSLPESKYDELKGFLQTFGPVRIVKEAHPRIMPAGQIRLILWLEEISTDKNDFNGEPKTN